MSSQMVFWMLPPQLELAAPMVVGSSLVMKITESLALSTMTGAIVGAGMAVGGMAWVAAGFSCIWAAGASFCMAGASVGAMSNALGLATVASGAAGCDCAWGTAVGWAAAPPQATATTVNTRAKANAHRRPKPETYLVVIATLFLPIGTIIGTEMMLKTLFIPQLSKGLSSFENCAKLPRVIIQGPLLVNDCAASHQVRPRNGNRVFNLHLSARISIMFLRSGPAGLGDVWRRGLDTWPGLKQGPAPAADRRCQPYVVMSYNMGKCRWGRVVRGSHARWRELREPI